MATEPHILVVDDDPLLRLGLLTMLRDMGYPSLAARDAERALPLLDQSPEINCLITDYHMPGMTGLELAQKAAKGRPDLHVVIVTGTANLFGALQPGWKTLVKPFTPHELATTLGLPVSSLPSA